MNVDILRYYSETELEYVGKLNESIREIRNPIVRILIESVSRDSLKHAMIYKAIISILEGEGPLLSDEESERIREEIGKHIKSEEDMIKHVEKLLENGVGNKAIKFLLEAILKDEVLHHSMLKRIYEMIVEEHTLTESDLWDMIWRDTVFHGTPGG